MVRAGSAENGTPHATSHSIAAALCSAMKRAVCSSTSPAPASCVSCTCDSMLSSSPSTPTMPPCAQAVAPSPRSRLARTITVQCSARCSATVRPARPAPTTTTGCLTSGFDDGIGSCSGLPGAAAVEASERSILSTRAGAAASARCRDATTPKLVLRDGHGRRAVPHFASPTRVVIAEHHRVPCRPPPLLHSSRR